MKKVSPELTLVIFAVLLLLGGTFDVLWSQYTYGDWRCAFSNCVKVAK